MDQNLSPARLDETGKVIGRPSLTGQCLARLAASSGSVKFRKLDPKLRLFGR